MAAAFTAFPETFIALVASLSSDSVRTEIGVASVLSAPSITLLLGFPVLAALGAVKGNPERVVPLYSAFAIGTALLPITTLLGSGVVRPVGLAYVAAYVPIAKRIVAEEGELMEGKELSIAERFTRVRHTSIAFTQAVAGLLLLTFSADQFISTVSLSSSPFAVAMVLSPLATCVEEVLVAFYWALRNKGDAAASLLAGENAIQATFVYGAGLLFTGAAPTPQGVSVVPVYVLAAVVLVLMLRLGAVRASGVVALLYGVYLFVWSRQLL